MCIWFRKILIVSVWYYYWHYINCLMIYSIRLDNIILLSENKDYVLCVTVMTVCVSHVYKYSKIPLSRTWFISNTPLISKSVAGSGRFPYINDFNNIWYLEHGISNIPLISKCIYGPQPCSSRSEVKFLVCLAYLASLRHQLTPAAISTLYNLC
jgi:hypothetical protein